MYNYTWDKKTRGYKLTTQNSKFVASEIRPVFAEELNLLGFDEHFDYEKNEKAPLMWAKNNVYYYNGEEAAKILNMKLGYEPHVEYLIDRKKIFPVNIVDMIEKNSHVMKSLVSNTLKRIKEMYDEFKDKQDIVYIAFSGGKDSVLLLDLCNKVLPKNVPVIFSDTTMELPDTYLIWKQIQKLYPERNFLKFSTEESAEKNWIFFGPPSRTLDWCCAVHKSSPAIIALKEYLQRPAIKTMAFLGVRSDESLKRDSYPDDIAIGVKNASQINAMPILSWGTHELFLYCFKHDLLFHPAYYKGVPRIGCAMCPKASDKYAWFVDKVYPNLLNKYSSLIIDLSLKNFGSAEEEAEYIACSGWQARRNGLEIRNRIFAPIEKRYGDKVDFLNMNVPYETFLAWLQTIGNITFETDCKIDLQYQRADDEHCTFSIELDVDKGKIKNIYAQLQYTALSQKKIMQTALRKVIFKSIACIGCRACEAECSFGALSISYNKISVDKTKCVHCLKCHDIDYGCWRYKSMMVPNNSNSPLKSIANYQNFGLRESWIQVYCDEGETFAQNTTLGGGPMIDSAKIWFRQALLTKDSKSLEPGKILQIASAFGTDSDLFWCLIWIALCNNSPLLKWFATNIAIGEKVSADDINDKLGDLSPSAKRGGMQALFNFFKSSPIGKGENVIVQLEQKGVRVVGLKRVPKSVEPLVVLYSLYLMANVAERTAFTLSEMMSADFESPFISPLIAFGMGVDELKAQCMGISSVYPDFLSCSFSLGLDEIKVFPQKKTLNDVIGLILGE